MQGQITDLTVITVSPHSELFRLEQAENKYLDSPESIGTIWGNSMIDRPKAECYSVRIVENGVTLLSASDRPADSQMSWLSDCSHQKTQLATASTDILNSV